MLRAHLRDVHRLNGNYGRKYPFFVRKLRTRLEIGLKFVVGKPETKFDNKRSGKHRTVNGRYIYIYIYRLTAFRTTYMRRKRVCGGEASSKKWTSPGEVQFRLVAGRQCGRGEWDAYVGLLRE